jgi:hypothetical protein
VDFVIPRATAATVEGDASSIYGVSLVLQRSKQDSPEESSEDGTPADDTTINIVEEKKKLEGCFHCMDHQAESVLIGVTLISGRNNIIVARDILQNLFQDNVDLQSPAGNDGRPNFDRLISALDGFRVGNENVTKAQKLMEMYSNSSLSCWVDKPINAPRETYNELAGKMMLAALSPIPLALLIVATLLEQKIVFSSTRRSLLLSAVLALKQLLRPLTWCHLFVPYVPEGLAYDLLQYPAPFILGLASDDAGVLGLVRELPSDVTLVDLDVGRVILAPSLNHHAEQGSRSISALRSQVLVLAQNLGNSIGRQVDPESWLCDRPLFPSPDASPSCGHTSPYERLSMVCCSFIEELVAGTTSCCYWIEESVDIDEHKSIGSAVVDPTVLFDEDRFFEVKRWRAIRRQIPDKVLSQQPGSLSADFVLRLDECDLVLEVFLRCQSMNVYISSRRREDMMFSL